MLLGLTGICTCSVEFSLRSLLPYECFVGFIAVDSRACGHHDLALSSDLDLSRSVLGFFIVKIQVVI